jgi:hypothetical protein
MFTSLEGRILPVAPVSGVILPVLGIGPGYGPIADRLEEARINGMTVTEVQGFDRQ